MAEAASTGYDRRTLFELLGAAGVFGAAAGAGSAARAAPSDDALGRAWQTFARLTQDVPAQIAALDVPPTVVDQVEGQRLFLRYLTIGIDRYIEHSDPAFPAFHQPTRDGVRKYAGDSPEQLYDSAAVSGAYDYVVTGNANDTHMMELTLYSGALNSDGKARRLIDSVTEADIAIAPNGDFAVPLSRTEKPAGGLKLDPDSSSLVVRRYVRDPRRDRPRPLSIRRTSGQATLAPLAPDAFAANLERAANFAAWNVRTWAQWVNRIKATKRNRLVAFHDTGDIYTPAGHRYLDGYWSVPEGQALVLSFTPPPGKYWSFVPMNFWMESLEWRFGNQVFASSFATKPGPDGRVTLAIADRDPRIPGAFWLETLGHREGPMSLRLARHTGAMPAVTARLVRFAA